MAVEWSTEQSLTSDLICGPIKTTDRNPNLFLFLKTWRQKAQHPFAERIVFPIIK